MTNKQKAVRKANKNKDWKVTMDDINYRIDTRYWVTFEKGSLGYSIYRQERKIESYPDEVAIEFNNKQKATKQARLKEGKATRETSYIFDVEQGKRECFTGITEIT